jgi:hypothetical protein
MHTRAVVVHSTHPHRTKGKGLLTKNKGMYAHSHILAPENQSKCADVPKPPGQTKMVRSQTERQGKETQMSDGKYDELNNQFDISILT